MTQPKAHGLGLNLVPPDWPPLTLDELAPLLADVPEAGGAEAITWHAARPFAASAIVRGPAGAVFVKRHDARVRTLADLAAEHAFIAHLRTRGAPVPAVLAAARGPAGTYEVHALAPGHDAYRDAHSWTPLRDTADAHALGRALAGLHLAATGYAAPARACTLLVAGDALLRAPSLVVGLQGLPGREGPYARALHGRPWRQDFDRVLQPWHTALQPHLPALAPLWVHGDLHASNLFWQSGAVSAVVDFGLSNLASAAYDLATAIERNTIAWLAPPHDRARPDLARAMLHGYDEIRPRPAGERAALRHLLPVVHVDFALSELAYFVDVTGSAENAATAYGDFLLGHAAWFATAAGSDFLAGVDG